MANESDQALNNAPWWAKLGIVFGVPTMILIMVLFGVWNLLSGVGSEMVTMMKVMQNEMTKHSVESNHAIRIQAALVGVVRANCVNNAKDENGIRRCMDN